jgi:hypothetical protein
MPGSGRSPPSGQPAGLTWPLWRGHQVCAMGGPSKGWNTNGANLVTKGFRRPVHPSYCGWKAHSSVGVGQAFLGVFVGPAPLPGRTPGCVVARRGANGRLDLTGHGGIRRERDRGYPCVTLGGGREGRMGHKGGGLASLSVGLGHNGGARAGCGSAKRVVANQRRWRSQGKSSVLTWLVMAAGLAGCMAGRS